MNRHIFTENSVAASGTAPSAKLVREPTKRIPLSVLNTNQLFQRKRDQKNVFKKEPVFPDPQPSEISKFTIFEDSATSEVEASKSTKFGVPKYVTELITSETSCLLQPSKENVPWFNTTEQPAQRIDDSKWTQPYIKEVYLHLKEVERKYRPRVGYMNKQTDISSGMRTTLVDWMVEVSEEYKLQEETLHIAVSLTDRFLSQMLVGRSKLQLVGTACMFIASKYEEIYPPELKDFVYITDDTYSKQQILRMEQLIMVTLSFSIGVPTSNTFLHLLASLSNVPEKTVFLGQYICELSLLEDDPFLQFLPSEMGSAALALANYIQKEKMWSDKLAEATGYSLKDLEQAVQCLYCLYSTTSSLNVQAIQEKYRSRKCKGVAEILCPNYLFIA